MKHINWLNQMKIRLGFGVTGNQGINPYATFSDYSQIIDYAKSTGDQILAMAVSNLQDVYQRQVSRSVESEAHG